MWVTCYVFEAIYKGGDSGILGCDWCAFEAIYKGRDCGATVIGFSPYYTVSLDWRIAYAYIPFNVNRYYILTSKIPIQKGVSAMPPLLVMSRHSSAWGV